MADLCEIIQSEIELCRKLLIFNKKCGKFNI